MHHEYVLHKGGELYDGMMIPQLKDAVKNGYQMPMPELCPAFMYVFDTHNLCLFHSIGNRIPKVQK